MPSVVLELTAEEKLPAAAAMLAMHQQPADGTFWPRVEKDEAAPSAPVRRLGLQQAGQQEAGTALARQHAAGGPWLCLPSSNVVGMSE